MGPISFETTPSIDPVSNCIASGIEASNSKITIARPYFTPRVMVTPTGYTDFTWAEGRATQGCDRSAEPGAGMGGSKLPPFTCLVQRVRQPADFVSQFEYS
jgi:hypothetical protein